MIRLNEMCEAAVMDAFKCTEDLTSYLSSKVTNLHSFSSHLRTAYADTCKRVLRGHLAQDILRRLASGHTLEQIVEYLETTTIEMASESPIASTPSSREHRDYQRAAFAYWLHQAKRELYLTRVLK